ncbi:MAG: CPBP family intramembrane glutamic endopeptidase [Bacillota bacterium]
MIEEKNKKSKLRAILSSLVFSVILMIFPVTSGVIVVMNGMDAIQSYWMQGVFMMLSIAVPVVFMWITKMKPAQIGFTRVEKGSIKTVLYFVPITASKIGFLIFGVDSNTQTIIALAFFTIMIGLSEELYFRGIILRKLRSCFTIKQTVILSSVFFAAVHASQAFSGTGIIIVTLTIINALIFGVIASEIVILTRSIIPVIIWHVLYDFINWISVAKGTTEVTLIMIQSVIMVVYAYYLWTKLRR